MGRAWKNLYEAIAFQGRNARAKIGFLQRGDFHLQVGDRALQIK